MPVLDVEAESGLLPFFSSWQKFEKGSIVVKLVLVRLMCFLFFLIP